MGRSAIAELSTSNLLHNLKVIRSKTSAQIIAMVKANAYGHGLRSVSQRIEPHVDILGVASIDEALALRQSGIQIPILLAEGVFEPLELQVAADEGFQVVFHSLTQLQWLQNSILSRPLVAWLKVNTGMQRLGFDLSQAKLYYQQLSKMAQVQKPIKIISHLACANEFNHSLNELQLKMFADFTSTLTGEFSICNSAAIFQFPQSHYHFVRPGLALYGASPLANISAEELGLKPVMTLKTKLISIRKITQATTVGYGAKYSCAQDTSIGIIAFGYGDGYPITASPGTPVLIHGIKCPIIGQIAMDMITVDLGPCPKAQIGDSVILWGEKLPVEEIAQSTGGISYSILTSVQNRVHFSWI